MKKVIVFLLANFLIFSVFALSPSEEYDSLLNNLIHYDTPGYKNNCDSKIDFSQGALVFSANYRSIAVLGDGYFRVLDSNNQEFFTRNGNILIDNDFRMIILCDDTIYYLPLDFLPPSYTQVEIKGDGTVLCSYIIDNSTIETKTVGKIDLYYILNDDVETYDGYVIKTKNIPQKKCNDSIIKQGFLEESNISFEFALLRMLFCMEKMNSKQIKAKNVKEFIIKELLNVNKRKDLYLADVYPEGPAGEYSPVPILNQFSIDMYLSFLKRDYE
ncbi:MAG: hypothetical protein MJ162_05820 [Treponema sp.]|nr:hypothetical protein [Treponema sp.]